jgi:hypothetical protein
VSRRHGNGYSPPQTFGPRADRHVEGVGVVDDVHPEPAVLRLLRRLVLLAGLLAGFFLAGLVLAGPAQASGQGDSSGGGSATGTTSSAVHAVTSKVSSGKATSGKPASGAAISGKTSAKATSGKAASGHSTSGKATSAHATSGKATSAHATSGKATSAKATSAKATSGSAESGAARREAGTSVTSGRTTAPVAGPRARLVDDVAVAPRLSATPRRTVDRATSAVASPVLATATGSIAPRASTLPINLGTAPLSPPGLRSVLAPVGTVTSVVAHAAPAASSVLGPVVAAPRTLIQRSGVISRTGGVLVDTVTGLTDTTTALTRTVGELGGSVIGAPRGGLTGLTGLTGTVGTSAAGGPTAPPTIALASGTNADRFPAVASTPALPVLLGGLARDPVLGGLAPPTVSGSPSAPRLTVDAAAGPVFRQGLPGPPAPWDPVGPAAPAGTAGATAGTGATVPTGVLTDALAVPALLAGLVLIACGRRRAWWFPEVAIGPD